MTRGHTVSLWLHGERILVKKFLKAPAKSADLT
jgi:hypothetical protein